MVETVVITGCSSGLGRALAEALASSRDSQGNPRFQVYATARKVESLDHLKPLGVVPLALDVTNARSVSAAAKQIDGVDYLICNAGIGLFGPLVHMPEETASRVLETNVMGVLRCVQCFAPRMMEARSGRIIVIGSVSSSFVTPYGGAYSASKAAVQAMCESLRMELRPYSVQVCCVLAGQIRSEFGASAAKYVEQMDSASVGKYPREGILLRSGASQDGPGVWSAQATADDIISKAIISGAAPDLMRTAGKSLYFLLLGFLQTWTPLRWALRSKLSRRFGLDRMLPVFA